MYPAMTSIALQSVLMRADDFVAHFAESVSFRKLHFEDVTASTAGVSFI